MELLAPAGDADKMRIAIRYGADAVYLAAQDFGLRAASANFSSQELKDAVAYAHQRGVRVYLTVNILAHPDDLERFGKQVDDLAGAGADAMIVADPGIFSLIRKKAPDMKIHISTQASTCNAESCLFWHRLGAGRIVMARELTLAEIARIRRETPDTLELEAFVHGAMCLAYSGRCLLSAWFTGRDANRGRCAQSCRWSYELREIKRPDQPIVVHEDTRGTYLLNSRDLCLIEYLPELAAAGLNSLKIEGRVKSSFYVATVVKAYRAALDAWMADPHHWRPDPAWLADLQKTVHRPFDTGFYFAKPQQDAKISTGELDQREAVVVGLVKAWLPESNLALVEQRNRIQKGDQLELVEPKGPYRPFIAETLLDLERKPIEATPHPRMLFYLPFKEVVEVDSFIRRRGNKDMPRQR
ncbi:MAG: U32 family peptidase [Bacillota bacterium]|nr:U32 family peptidase [Bacillota bacterium]